MPDQPSIIYTMVEDPVTKRPTLLLGVTRDAWNIIRKGGIQKFSLDKLHLPVDVEVYGHMDPMTLKVIMNRRIGVPTMDMKPSDFMLKELQEKGLMDEPDNDT